MTKSEIIEKAIRDFPVGSEYYPIDTDTFEVSDVLETVSRIPVWRMIDAIDAGIGYLYFEGKWAKPVIKSETKSMKNVKELSYPDVIFIKNEEEHSELEKHCKIVSFRGEGWYLLGAYGHSEDGFTGLSSTGKKYVEYYFSDLKFPEESPQFIVGKWYTGFASSPESLGKLTSKIESTERFPSTEYINPSKRYCKGSYFTGSHKNIVEANMEEVSKYLPEGHPDKLPKMNTL